jgi:hypothetical protein
MFAYAIGGSQPRHSSLAATPSVPPWLTLDPLPGIPPRLADLFDRDKLAKSLDHSVGTAWPENFDCNIAIDPCRI